MYINTKDGKREFIETMFKEMKALALSKLESFPDNWDGLELRTWLAEAWGYESAKKRLGRKRFKAFKSDIYNHNL